MIAKGAYTLHCSGCLESVCLAELLFLFASRQINIRKLSLLPDLALPPQTISHQARLEILFDLYEEKEPFLESLNSFFSRLPAESLSLQLV